MLGYLTLFLQYVFGTLCCQLFDPFFICILTYLFVYLLFDSQC